MKNTRNRTRLIQFLFMSSCIVTLTACEEKPKEKAQDKPLAFKDEQECRKTHTEEECKKALEESKAKYAETAPKFTSKEECEKQYGPGKCAEGPHRHGEHGGGFFMPMMMGFMMGHMLGGHSQPALPPVVGGAKPGMGSATPPAGPRRAVTRGGFGSKGSFRSSGS